MTDQRPHEPPTELLASLESDQFVAAKPHYQRRRLSGRLQCLFWGLRVYVLVMVVVILLLFWHH
ncbi:MAG: hypothetical protein ACRD2E_09905 [Terriglobales bacterium]